MDKVDSMTYRHLFSRYTSPLVPEPTPVSPLLPELNNVDVILFDVYGTLIISSSGDIGTVMEDSEGEDFRQMLHRELNVVIPETTRVDVLLKDEIRKEHTRKKALGIIYPEVDIRSVWQMVLGRIFPGRVSADTCLLAEKIALLHELSRNRVWPMPGSRELLNLLAGTFRIGIVSNAQFYTPLMLHFFFDTGVSVFDEKLCIWSYREGTAKPDPALFTRTLTSLGRKYLADPSRVLYVGNDMLNDIAAASSVGMRTLLFAGDKRSLRLRNSDPRVVHVQPDGIVKDFNQMAQILCVGEQTG